MVWYRSAPIDNRVHDTILRYAIVKKRRHVPTRGRKLRSVSWWISSHLLPCVPRYAIVKKRLLHHLTELLLDLHLQRIQLPLDRLLPLGRTLQTHYLAPPTLIEPNTNLEFHL